MPDDGLSFASERLLLRPMVATDYSEWERANQALKPPQDTFDTAPAQKNWICPETFNSLLDSGESDRERGHTYHFLAFDKQSQHLIGDSQLWSIQRGDCQRATLGFSVLNTHWRQGYGFEIAKATLNYGIKSLQLNRIEAEIIPTHQASIALCKKLGMQSEGIRRSALHTKGQWQDHCVYALIASDLDTNESLD